MSLDDTSTVDAAGVDRVSGNVVLTIADSWDWDNIPRLLFALQEKLNSYIQFIEGGQVFESFPEARGRGVIIDIITRFPMPREGVRFLEEARKGCAALDCEIRSRHYSGG